MSVLKPSALAPKKKPYQKPSLRVYGDIRTMTQAANHQQGTTDAAFMNKTG